MWTFTSVTITLAALALLNQTLQLDALDVESSKESECFEIKETVSMDMQWVMSQKTWYYPIMSRFDLYMSGVEVSGKSAKDLHEDELYYDSCFTFEMKQGVFMVTGFNGKKKTVSMKPVKGIEIYDCGFGEEDAQGGRCYTTLTDNKTFAVAACCMSNNQMTWGVMSTLKKLPKETEQNIYDHVESLGYKREHFTALRYDSCDLDKNENQGKKKNEL